MTDHYHIPKPFFRPRKKRWYVQLDGKHINLGPDEQTAWTKYHEIMAARAKEPKGSPPPSTGLLVVVVLDAYLDWLHKRVQEGTKAPRTYDWYRKYLSSFGSFQNADYRVRDLTVDRLEPVHVYQWADANPGWKTGKRGAMTAVQRAFNWAAKAGLLRAMGGKSPLTSLEKPAQGRRELLVSEEEYREVLGVVEDQEFRDLLELSWETGSRPHELFSVEAAFADLDTGRWVFPIQLSKGKKVQRVVYLSERALEITRRLVLKRPSGPLLLNTDGRPWCASSVKCRFQMICRNLGRRRLRRAGLVPAQIPRLKAHERQDPGTRAQHEQKVLARRQRVNQLARQHGKRFNLYAFRHSYITESLVSGLDAVTVSVLAGHRDTVMISRVYAHLSEKAEHLRDAARRVRGA
jgi:integrase